jgi:hypothetical protein
MVFTDMAALQILHQTNLLAVVTEIIEGIFVHDMLDQVFAQPLSGLAFQIGIGTIALRQGRVPRHPHIVNANLHAAGDLAADDIEARLLIRTEGMGDDIGRGLLHRQLDPATIGIAETVQMGYIPHEAERHRQIAAVVG